MHADGPSKPVLSVALMPRSLLVFHGEAYEDCLHGIDEVCPLQTTLLDCHKKQCPVRHLACSCRQAKSGMRMRLQVEADVMDDSVANRAAVPASVNGTLPRDRERYSLTVRRVLRTKNLLGKCK